jgi:hypothetical protein
MSVVDWLCIAATVVIIGLLFISFKGEAQTPPAATVKWVMPTQYNDDSALPLADIAKSTVKWPGGSLDVPAPTASASVPVPCGDRVFTVTVTTKATAKYPNATSGDSAQVTFATGVTCAPKAPTGIEATR